MARNRITQFVQAQRTARRLSVIGAALAVVLSWNVCVFGAVLPTADGFYGIWYSLGPTGDQYGYKYSGGLGTYPQPISSLAFYAAEVDRTYFVYGGTDGTSNSLRNYVSYYDHATHLMARPREFRNIGGNDIHKNASITIDPEGYVNIFGTSHGNAGTGNHYRSAQPYSIAEFNEIPLPGSVFNNNAGAPKLAYSNPFYVPGNGLMVVFTDYDDGRATHVATTTNGTTWVEKELFDTEAGHYAIARQNGNTIGISADYHRDGILNRRTNLYYIQTNDFGQTWTNAAGAEMSVPLTTRNNASLVHDYYAENQSVYMKDVDYDAAGNPILLYLTVNNADNLGHRPGPKPDGRTLHTAHWTGGQWQIRDVLQTDHSYDHGELSVDPDGTWRLIGPFIDGPQVYGTGGEVGMWTSQNQGASWQLADQLTQGSTFNHTYVRMPQNADDDFAAFWADGDAFAQSSSRLYFANKDGDVFRMPTHFVGDSAAPVLVTDFSIPNPDPNPNPPPPTLSAYEGLAYPNDGPGINGRNDGSGWRDAWRDTDSDFQHLKHTGNSLSSPAFPFTSTGARLEGKGGDASRAFSGDFDLGKNSGDIFVSFLMRKNVNGGTSGDNVELNLADGTTEIVRVGSTSDDMFYLGSSVSGGQAVVGDPIVFGETYFVVLKGTASASGNDVFKATFYDSASVVPQAEPSEWDLTWTRSSSAVLDTIRLALGANATGAFDELRVGSTWDAVAVPGLDGDFNGDGSVDTADYIIWRKGLGTIYDQEDYDTWRANFGNTLEGEGVAIPNADNLASLPEPATWMMLLITCQFATTWRFANKF